MVKICGSEFLDLTREVFHSGRKIRFTAKGMSMYPFIKNGDILEIKPIDGKAVLTGDIILYYRKANAPIVHRVVTARRKDGWVVTRGDNNLTTDSPININQILGKVTMIEKTGCKINLDRMTWYWLSKLLAWFSPVRVRYLQLVRRMKGMVKECWDTIF